jgi:ATP-dependent exoDNAse (exonuclease V) alpha subunit
VSSKIWNAPIESDNSQYYYIEIVGITPISKMFVRMKNGEKMTVNRSQLPLTLAYAFTDYRSQGQTLQPVYVDIGSPHMGS